MRKYCKLLRSDLSKSKLKQVDNITIRCSGPIPEIFKRSSKDIIPEEYDTDDKEGAIYDLATAIENRYGANSLKFKNWKKCGEEHIESIVEQIIRDIYYPHKKFNPPNDVTKLENYRNLRSELLGAAEKMRLDIIKHKKRGRFKPYDHYLEDSCPKKFEEDIIANYLDYVAGDEISWKTYRSIFYPILIDALIKITPSQMSLEEAVADIYDQLIQRSTYAPGSFNCWDDENYRPLGGFYPFIEFDHTEFGDLMVKINKIISGLDAISKKTIKFFVDLIEGNPEMIINDFDTYIEILNKDAETSAHELLSKLRATKDKEIARNITKILTRLEFGKIGMSEEGVRYLEKQYDLGEHNDPSYFVHRVTADGKIGIFDEQKKAVGYFQLHGLDSPEKKLKAEVLQFEYETLFHPKPNETPEERKEREQILEEFKEKYFQTYLTDFNKETGIMFNNLNFKEQGWFLWYVQHANEEDKKRAMDFIKKYRETGFKTFLSLEQDRQNGNRILDLGEKLEPKLASKIFEKYLEITKIVENIGRYLKDYFKKDKNFSQEELGKFIENILIRAKDLLIEFANKVEKEKISAKEIGGALRDIKVDLVTFGAIFRTAFKGKEKVDFSEIKGLEFISKDASELSEEEKKEMEKIFIDNRRQYSKELLKATTAEFKGALRTAGKKYYLLTKDGKITSFMRFDTRVDKNGEKELYFASFNTRSELHRSSIGGAAMQIALEREAKGRKVELVVREGHPFIPQYEKLGFKKTETLPNYLGGGDVFIKMVRPPNLDLGQQADDLKMAA